MADVYQRLDEWQCPKCTYINQPSHKSCLICEYDNSIATSKKRSEPNGDLNGTSATSNSYDKYKSVFKTKLNSIGSDVKNFINGLNNATTSSGGGGGGGDVIEIDPRTGRPIGPPLPPTTSIFPSLSLPNNKPSASSSSGSNGAGAGSGGKLWTCRSCTFSANPDWTKTCEICNRRRSSDNNNAATAAAADDDDEDIKVYDTTLDRNVYDYARIWTCKRCTYINFEKDKRCELCNTARRSSKDPSGASGSGGGAAAAVAASNDPLKNKWLCRFCTYLNDASQATEKCLACNSPKNDTTSLEARQSESKQTPAAAAAVPKTNTSTKRWACEICSHKNPATTSVCELCENNVENLLSISERNTINNNDDDDDDDDDDEDMHSLRSHLDRSLSSSANGGDYYNATMNPSLTYRSKKAMSTLKTYTNATNQAEKIWKNIVKYCKEHNHKFIDDSFPPCDKSLFINPNEKPANMVNKGIRWLSPEHIRTNPSENGLKWTVYNNPKFNDIKQGLLGNCWLLSGLAVILEQPELLNKIIITKEYCSQGCYLVRLCHNGEWQTVILDDLFPCDASGYLLYSQANRKQLWVPLIEKAMAKLNGSYESLIAGQTVEGLSALTGYPCDSIRLEKVGDDEEEIDLEMVWVRLLSMKEAGYALGASCGKTNIEDDTIFTSHGLLPRHAYSILNVKEVSGNQLVQLRNPWGDWSEGSPKWTPALRKALGLKSSGSSMSTLAQQQQQQQQPTSNRQDDNHYYNHHYRQYRSDEGVFWMSFYDFVKYFCSIDICKARLDWFESRMSGFFSAEGTREMQAYHLIVFETAELNIGLFHKTVKNRRENSDLDMCFAVLQTNGARNSVGKLVKSSKRSIRKFVGLEHIFEPGEYLIVPFSFNFWYTTNSVTNGKDNNLYNLVFHSPKTFFIEQEMHSALLLADTIIQMCLTLGTRTYSGIEKACIYTLAKGHSGLIVVAENCNERAYLHIELDCENSTNVVSTRQALVTKDSVPPLHRQVLLLLTQLEGSSSYSIQYSIKYRLSSNPYLNTWPGVNERVYFTNAPEISKKTFGLHAPRSVFL